jgi:hypothetical protein
MPIACSLESRISLFSSEGGKNTSIPFCFYKFENGFPMYTLWTSDEVSWQSFFLSWDVRRSIGTTT